MYNHGIMHTLNRPFVYFVCIFCYLVIRGCFHVLKLSDLFIKKCYFPVLRLHHLQKSEIVMWWLLIITAMEIPLSQCWGGLLRAPWLRQRRRVPTARVNFADKNVWYEKCQVNTAEMPHSETLLTIQDKGAAQGSGASRWVYLEEAVSGF